MSPPSSAKATNSWISIFTPSYVCMSWCIYKHQGQSSSHKPCEFFHLGIESCCGCSSNRNSSLRVHFLVANINKNKMYLFIFLTLALDCEQYYFLCSITVYIKLYFGGLQSLFSINSRKRYFIIKMYSLHSPIHSKLYLVKIIVMKET
jgi:hypothetical protein